MFCTKPRITNLTMYNLDTDSAQEVKHPIYHIFHAYQDLEKDELITCWIMVSFNTPQVIGVHPL